MFSSKTTKNNTKQKWLGVKLRTFINPRLYFILIRPWPQDQQNVFHVNDCLCGRFRSCRNIFPEIHVPLSFLANHCELSNCNPGFVNRIIAAIERHTRALPLKFTTVRVCGCVCQYLLPSSAKPCEAAYLRRETSERDTILVYNIYDPYPLYHEVLGVTF